MGLQAYEDENPVYHVVENHHCGRPPPAAPEWHGKSACAVTSDLRIEPLASHREVLPVLQQWFESEWPTYYSAGGRGSARQDLEAYANQRGLPFGLVAFRDDSVCGVAVLKADSISTHTHLSPWAAGGLVRRDLRGQGIGEQLVLALERQARFMGFSRIYCGTSTAESLLQRAGWRQLERIDHEGEVLGIYEKAL